MLQLQGEAAVRKGPSLQAGHVHSFQNTFWEQLWKILYKPSSNGEIGQTLYMSKILKDF